MLKALSPQINQIYSHLVSTITTILMTSHVVSKVSPKNKTNTQKKIKIFFKVLGFRWLIKINKVKLIKIKAKSVNIFLKMIKIKIYQI